MAAEAESPTRVAKIFVRSYYDYMASKPNELHKFFDRTNSSFTHADGGEEVQPVVGRELIKHLLPGLGFEGATISIDPGSMDCQWSVNQGVIVMVTGVLKLQHMPPRAFVQTFFLAQQPKADKKSGAYYVHNVILRLLHEDVAAAGLTARLEAEAAEKARAEAEAEAKAKADAELRAAIERDEAAKRAMEEAAAAAAAAEEAAAAAAEAVEAASETPAEPVPEAATNGVQAEAAASEEPAQPEAAPPAPRPTSYAAAAAARAAPPPAPKPAAPRVQPRRTPANAGAGAPGDAAAAPRPKKSLYLRVSSSASETEIKELLSRWGTAIHVNQTQKDRGFVFVEMATREEALAAIDGAAKAKAEDNELLLHDQPVTIVERRDTPRGAGRGGGRGRGRSNRTDRDGNGGRSRQRGDRREDARGERSGTRGGRGRGSGRGRGRGGARASAP